MYIKIKLITMLAIFVFIQSCNLKEKQKENKKMIDENFSYSVTITAPKEYSVEVHEGWLLNSNKQMICGMPKAGKTTGSWEYDGTKAGQGGSEIPSHLNLTYIAYAEKKFYTVDAALPKDKILKEFRKGFTIEGDPDEKGIKHIVHGTYDTFTVGAAPGGVIIVWLSAYHHRVEICRLQAKEVFVDRNDFYDNPHDRTQQEFYDTLYDIMISDSIRTEIQSKGFPFGLWDQYREKYKYRFLLNSYDENDIITFESISYFNGEANIFYDPDLVKNNYVIAALPHNANISFKKYNCEIYFDYVELSKIFESFKKKYPEKPIDIILTPTFLYNDIKISVKCENEEIVVTKAKINEIWGG